MCMHALFSSPLCSSAVSDSLTRQKHKYTLKIEEPLILSAAGTFALTNCALQSSLDLSPVLCNSTYFSTFPSSHSRAQNLACATAVMK